MTTVNNWLHYLFVPGSDLLGYYKQIHCEILIKHKGRHETSVDVSTNYLVYMFQHNIYMYIFSL